MKFLAIYKTAETGDPPTLEYITRMNQLVDEMKRSGVLLATEGSRK